MKAVVVPIYRKEEERSRVLEAAHKMAADAGAKVDDREGQTPGSKFFHWERFGVPVVLGLGPRDLASGHIMRKRRDTGAKKTLAQTDLVRAQSETLDVMQKDLFRAAKDRVKANTVLANSIPEVQSILAEASAEKGGRKFVMAHLKDELRCDAQLKEFKATVRSIPLVDEFDGPGKCIITRELVDRRVVIAKAY